LHPLFTDEMKGEPKSPPLCCPTVVIRQPPDGVRRCLCRRWHSPSARSLLKETCRHVIDDVTAVPCELIAHWDDRNMRRLSVKQIVELIPKRVAAFRAEGRYPGGKWPGMPPVVAR
jgi:hypothetical protein